MYMHLDKIVSNHPGQLRIRPMYDAFDVSGPNEQHACLIYPPMHITMLGFMRKLPRRRLDQGVLRITLQYLLSALGFLHTEIKVIHTGRSSARAKMESR